MIKHIKSFIMFYVSTESFRAISSFDYNETKARIASSTENKVSDVGVNIQGEKFEIYSKHAGSALAPVLNCKIEQSDGYVYLEGRLGLDFPMRMTVWGFLAFFLFVIDSNVEELGLRGSRDIFAGLGLWFLILEGAYFSGKSHKATIISEIKKTLTQTPVEDGSLDVKTKDGTNNIPRQKHVKLTKPVLLLLATFAVWQLFVFGTGWLGRIVLSRNKEVTKGQIVGKAWQGHGIMIYTYHVEGITYKGMDKPPDLEDIGKVVEVYYSPKFHWISSLSTDYSIFPAVLFIPTAFALFLYGVYRLWRQGASDKCLV